MKRLVLVDGNYMCSRAYHSYGHLHTTTGKPTGTIYGFLATLRAQFMIHNPLSLIVLWDFGKSQKRLELWGEYKAGRKLRTDAWFSQVNIIHDILYYMGVPRLGITGVEADDLFGILVKDIGKEFDKIILVTADTDLYQLIDGDKVVHFNPQLKRETNEEILKNSLGLNPSQIVDYKALVGDKDEVPGVDNVGKKTVLALLKRFGSIDNFDRRVLSSNKRTVNILSQWKKMELGKKLACLLTLDELTEEQKKDYYVWMEGIWKKRPLSIDKRKLTFTFEALEFKWAKDIDTFIKFISREA